MSSAEIFSFFLISVLRGKRYVPLFLSGNMEVFQVVVPMVALTFNEPQPRLKALKRLVICRAWSLGIEIKCQAAIPE